MYMMYRWGRAARVKYVGSNHDAINCTGLTNVTWPCMGDDVDENLSSDFGTQVRTTHQQRRSVVPLRPTLES